MYNARQAAYLAIFRCLKENAYSAQTISALSKQLSSNDAALFAKITLGVLRNTDLLDYQFDRYCSKLEFKVRCILRIGVYQLLFLDKIPVHAAVNETVSLCRYFGCAKASGLVNAVLRKVKSAGLSFPDELSKRYSHPEWFVRKIIKEKGLDFTEALLEANNRETETEKHIAFSPGEIYVQDKAAYESVKMAEPMPGMHVLDACAAPGGKSFTASVLMNNIGEIVSCDINAKKLKLIEDSAKRLGIKIIKTMELDAGIFRPEFENYFDIVISDVPCSGFGVIRKKPEIRFKSEEDISTLPAIQKKILYNTSRYVKPGGTLLYSTCTVFREENENIVEEFINNNMYSYNLSEERTFWPNVDYTDGFFAAKLKRSN